MRRLVQRHALSSFLVLAFLFSWAAWFTSWLIEPIAPTSASVLDVLATFGPAAGAVCVAAALRGPTAAVRRSWPSIVVAVVVTGLAIWCLAPLWTAAAAAQDVVAGALLVVASSAPGALVWGARPSSSLHGLLGPLLAWRRPPGLYAIAVLIFPAVSLLGALLLAAFGTPVAGLAHPGPPTELALTFVFTALFGGPLGEEIGWRGLALPRLLERDSPLLSSLLLGLAWGAWHLPLHLRGAYDQSMGEGIAGFALRLLSSASLAVLFTWLYRRAAGSLLLMVLLHTSVNNTSGYWLPVHPGVQLVLLPVLLVMVLTDRMWVKPAPAVNGAPRDS